MSENALSKLRRLHERAAGHVARIKDKAESTMAVTLHAVENGGVAFAFGYANVRYGKPDSGGINAVLIPGTKIPVDLTVGLAGHAAALFGVFGKQADHAHAIANGALGVYLGRLGGEMGVKALVKKNSSAGMNITGLQQIGTGAFQFTGANARHVQHYDPLGMPVRR